MKYRVKISLLVLLFPFCFTSAFAQDSDFRFGVGLGKIYSGLGVNASKVNDTEAFIVSAGLISSSSWGGNAYGAGFSYHRADLVGVTQGEPNRHALGLYIGAVDSQNFLQINDQAIGEVDNKTIWGGGLGYFYYQNGIRNPGFLAGVSTLYGKRSNYTASRVSLSFGYRF